MIDNDSRTHTLNNRANQYKLLAVLQDYAPTGTAQERVTKKYNNLLRNPYFDGEQITSILADWLVCGIQEGLWPWEDDGEPGAGAEPETETEAEL